MFFVPLSFSLELQRVLPPDLPHREQVIQKAALHLGLIEEINQVMNLTRIVSASDAAIKHVFDSVWPWRHFAKAHHVLDIGSGAGFPGIPLALCLPGVRFTLSESIQKKARFLADACRQLHLENVQVVPDRAEQLLQSGSFDLLTARASRTTVVSDEELVERDVVEASPERTRLFGFEVDLLVEAPGGARPGSAPPLYEDDDAWFAANARDPAAALLGKI